VAATGCAAFGGAAAESGNTAIWRNQYQWRSSYSWPALQLANRFSQRTGANVASGSLAAGWLASSE